MLPLTRTKAPCEGVEKLRNGFRHYPGTLRSDHPQTSFCASGKDAAYITEGHALTPQFGDASPVGKGYR